MTLFNRSVSHAEQGTRGDMTAPLDLVTDGIIINLWIDYRYTPLKFREPRRIPESLREGVAVDLQFRDL